jgi:hypothetical protein
VLNLICFYQFFSNQQHFSAVCEQPQVGSELLSIPLMMPVAHPTPERTEMAPNLQLRAQAPHSMQLFISVILALPPVISKTACGQTMLHIPQPVHRLLFNFNVTTFFKYCMTCF